MKFLLILVMLFPLIGFSEKIEEVQDVEAQAKRAFLDGTFLLKRNSYEKAAAKFKLAIEKQPKLAAAHSNYAFALRQVNEEHYAESLKHYNIALKLDPRLVEAYQYRGCLHFLMGNPELAKVDYERLINAGEKDLAAKLKKFILDKAENPKEGGQVLSY